MAEHLLDQVAGIAESAKKASPLSLPLATLLREHGLVRNLFF